MNDLNHQLKDLLGTDNPSVNTIRELVSRGANVNAEFSGDSLLMHCVSNAAGCVWQPGGLDLKIIQLLIDLGADPNFKLQIELGNRVEVVYEDPFESKFV